MSTILEAKRLLKRACLLNLKMNDGLAITPLLIGQHGIGKSAICKQVAADLGGVCLVVEGGSLKEGEITGLPFASKDENGGTAVEFTPYMTTAKIKLVEQEIYKQASGTGFINGTIRLTSEGTVYTSKEDGKNTEKLIPTKHKLHRIVEGKENLYKFGEDLPAEVKMELLRSGEIMPVLLFIDEMNRTDNQTMKELMNIVLTRSVNGYDFPWWVFVVSAINPSSGDSVYSTNEMDPAQRDRFLSITLKANIDEFVEYGRSNNISDEYLLTLAQHPDILYQTGAGLDAKIDKADETYSPRSHEICDSIYKYRNFVDRSGFIKERELEFSNMDTETLIIGKVGNLVARQILNGLKNSKNYINPSEIITGKSKTVKPDIKKKITELPSSLSRRIICGSVLNYVYTHADQLFGDINTVEGKNVKANTLEQIRDFLSAIPDEVNTIYFAKESVNMKLESKVKHLNQRILFKEIASSFTKEILEQVGAHDMLTKSDDINKS